MNILPTEPGYVYLLHFEHPIAPGRHTAQHYIGYAADLAARLQEHGCGHGARLTQVARERGIRWTLARVWHGDRGFERRLKNRKGANRLCPICGRGRPVRGSDEITQDLADFAIPF